MIRFLFAIVTIAMLASPTTAQVLPFPKEFRTKQIAVDGAELHVRVAGSGPAVVLLHGYTQTGDMWAPLAAELVATRTVIVPDLRGLGRSSRPNRGYDKVTQARDIARVLDRLGKREADIVGHDIGTMVAFTFAASFPERTRTLIVMDAPIPGVGPWNDIVRNRALWHFSFGGADAERLVADRERIYLDRFWNEFAGNPERITEATRRHYAELYAQPGAMRAGFAHFAAFERDATDNQALLAPGKLAMPVLAIGGEQSFGSTMATVMRAAASNVRGVVVSNAGHWLMEEQPSATISTVTAFLNVGN